MTEKKIKYYSWVEIGSAFLMSELHSIDNLAVFCKVRISQDILDTTGMFTKPVMYVNNGINGSRNFKLS